MLKGLETISDLIQIYKIREDVYLKSNPNADLEKAITQLYSHILEYQARMICHLSRKAIKRAWNNTINAGQWDEWLNEVKRLDQQCEKYLDLVGKQAEDEHWERQRLQMEESHEVGKQIFEALAAMRRDRAEEQLNDLKRDFFRTFSSPYAEDKDFNPERVPGTCRWFLEDDRFQKWRDSPHSSFLWVSAGPGCGKSVLSRFLVDGRLVTRSLMASTVCYFFFKDGQEGRQKGENALTAILHQLYTSNIEASLVNHALPKFKDCGTSLCQMLGELWNILVETAKDPAAGEIVCVLDAFDECDQTARSRLTAKLVSFYSDGRLEENPDLRLKFLVTSRPYDSVESEFSELSKVATFIPFDADEKYSIISEEINLVIDYQLPRLVGRKIDAEGQSQIAKHLKASVQRTYLWLYLIFDVIKRKITSHGTAKKVQRLTSSLPSTVYDAYEEILKKSSEPEMAREVLHIIIAARRPLTVAEMNVALALATSDTCTSYDELDLQQDDAFKSSLRDICGLFISIHDSKVYLLHQTAREFLLRKPQGAISQTPGSLPIWQHTIDEEAAEQLMARVCVSLLSFTVFVEDDITQNTFLEYSSQHWAAHYRLTQDCASNELSNLALRICKTNEAHFERWYSIYSKVTDKEYSELVILSKLGMHVLCEQLLARPSLVKMLQEDYVRALYEASVQGYDKVVELLLGKGADVNAQGGKYGNALQAASVFGHDKVVELLLGKGANVNAQGGYYDNALHAASVEGHDKVVELLLGKGADVNAQGGIYINALQAASVGGHDKVVELLLGKGADVNAQGGLYSNALQAASVFGHDKVVELLLGKGADVNAQGKLYGNALQAASYRGYGKVVELLLGKGADVNAQGGYYGNALQAASAGGRDKVVELLLSKGATTRSLAG